MTGYPFIAAALLSSHAFAADRDPNRVQILEAAPKDCVFVGSVEVDAARLIPVMNSDAPTRRAARKARRAVAEAQDSAAAMGADTLVIPSGPVGARALSGTAQAFRCGKEPLPASMGAGEVLSAKERVGKHYVAAFEPLGLGTPLGLGQAVNGGLFLDPDRVLEASAAFASADASSSQTFSPIGSTDNSFGDNARVDGHASIVAVRYKAFVTNSFYWYAGGADRMTRAAMYVVPEGSGSRTKIASVDVHDLGATGAIGNQWQWETFTIGCDWIGLYLPLVPLKRHYSDESASLSAYSSDIGKARDSFKNYTTSFNVTGLRLYLGASF